jgi:fructokinase
LNSVVAIGETVYDIIFSQGQPVAARAGGSMLNTAISLGRCHYEVKMITELGDDHVGKLVMEFLSNNGVTTSFIKPATGFKTPVSLAFLDDQGNAHYSFYKDYPKERLNIRWPEVNRGDIVLFGSFYSLGKGVREKLIAYVQNAKTGGALMVYDPNIRKNHLDEIRQHMDLVEENIALADIVRGSDEDFENLFGLKDPDQIFGQIKSLGCKNLIITGGKEGTDLLTANFNIHLPSKNIRVISTIGAGDAFNAGIIYGLMNQGLSGGELVNINPGLWENILEFGINFATDVCQSYENYISTEFSRKLNEERNLKQN